MPFNLQANKINVGDTDYPTKHNATVDAFESLGNDLETETTNTKNWTTTQVQAAAADAASAQTARTGAEAARDAAQTAEANATAIVYNSGGSTTPADGAHPVAYATGKLDDDWLTYTIPQLSALYPGLDVKAVCFYDTSNDSDGGAWIHRTEFLSYGQEAVPSGRYVGQFVGGLDAINNGSAQVGDWYYNTGNGFFKEITSGAGAEITIYRAGSKNFPSQVVIAAESDRVIIFDASGSELTMWLVLRSGVHFWDTKLSSVAAGEGVLSIGNKPDNAAWSGNGLFQFNFARGELKASTKNYGSFSPGTFAFDSTTGLLNLGTATLRPHELVGYSINAIATTTLDNAPVDPATGLKIPTVEVLTDGGVSVIQNDDTVVNSGATIAFHRGGFNGSEMWFAADAGNGDTRIVRDVASLANGFNHDTQYKTDTTPAMLAGGTASSLVPGARGSSNGLTLLHENPADPTKGMSAHITDKYNTGWMVGDTQLAFACKTAFGSLVGVDHSVNGGFDTDTTWTKGDGWSISGGVATCDGTQAGNSSLQENATLVSGNNYVLTFEVTAVNAGAINYVDVGGVVFNDDISTTGKKSFALTAVEDATTIAIVANSSFNGSIDNVVLMDADADLSGNDNHVPTHGTLSLSAIGSGEIAAIEGFTRSGVSSPYALNDHLRVPMPLIPDGVSDWCFMGWVNFAPYCGVITDHPDLNPTNGGNDFNIESGGANGKNVRFIGWTNTLTSNVEVDTGTSEDTYVHVVCLYNSSTNKKELWVNGVKEGEATAGAWVQPDELAYGNISAGNAPNGIALVKIGNTLPSADQIKKIYRDESRMLKGGAVLDGDDSDVKALAYDQERDLLRVASEGVVSTFQGLERVASSLDGAAELALNGTFDADSDWTKGTGWTISGGLASSDGTQTAVSNLKNDGATAVPADAVYLVTWTVSNSTVGTTKANLGEWSSAFSGNGTFTAVLHASGAGEKVLIQASADFVGDVDNVSVKAVSRAAPFQSIDATNGALLLTGANGLDADLPAVNIRERLAQALNDPKGQREDFEFTGDGTETDFALPKGWKPKRAYIDGSKKREGSAEDYTVKYDGFVYSVSFAVAPALNAEIDVEAVAA